MQVSSLLKIKLGGRSFHALFQLLKLLGRLLDVEAALKLGSPADVAFRDGLLGQSG